jgi:two-component system chemotaxis response regulator CheB
MERHPTPILMLSAHTGEGASVSFEALDRGAVDVFAKPGGEVSAGVSRVGEQLVETVRAVAAADVTDGSAGDASERTGMATADADASAVVVIASSTGGPNAVEQVLASIPADAGVSVIVVQHMPAGFTGRFAERLDGRSELSVREATDGDRIGPGEALVVPGDYHLEVSHASGARVRVSLDSDDRGESIQPAADVTMRSAASAVDGALVGVVLTGMGRDGAAGVEAIHDADGRILAQDEATCAIYGMPKRAVETGCVDDVLPIDEMADGVLDAAASFVEREAA